MHRRIGLALAAVGTLTCVGCGYSDSKAVRRAQKSLVGLSSEQLHACAGVPTSSKKLNDKTEILQYTGTKATAQPGNFTVIPVQQIWNVTSLALGGGGTACSTIFHMKDNRVTEVHYTGDNDEIIGRSGICAILVRGCLRTPPLSEDAPPSTAAASSAPVASAPESKLVATNPGTLAPASTTAASTK